MRGRGRGGGFRWLVSSWGESRLRSGWGRKIPTSGKTGQKWGAPVEMVIRHRLVIRGSDTIAGFVGGSRKAHNRGHRVAQRKIKPDAAKID